MKTLMKIVLAGFTAVSMAGTYAADDMKKDGAMMKKDEMTKDGMAKKDAMTKDAMKKDEMKK